MNLFAVIFQLRDVLKWSLCGLAVEHHTLMCHLPMSVSMQCWTAVQNNRCRLMAAGLILSAAFCRYVVSCYLYRRWGNAWCTVSVQDTVQSHLIIDFKLISPFSFQLICLPPFLRLETPVKLRIRCWNSRLINKLCMCGVIMLVRTCSWTSYLNVSFAYVGVHAVYAVLNCCAK